MGVQANDMEAQLSSNARDLLRQVHKACYPKVAPEALELFFLNNGIDDIEDLAAMLDEVSLMECGIPRAASRVAIRRITDQILKPEVVEPSCEESPREIEVKNSIEDQVSRFLGANSSRLNSETKVEAEEVTVSPKSLTKRRMSVDLKASLEIAEAANAAEACCVDAAQAAEQAAEFVRQAEAEARSQPRDSSAAAMSDVEAMLAQRGAAAGSEAINTRSESPAQSPPATRLSAGIYDQAAALKAAAAEAVAALSQAKSATAALNNLYEVDDTPKKSWKISVNSKGHTELTTTQAAPEKTAEACCVDAAQAAEQAAEFVKQAEAEARSQPRDSSAAAMSDVEAMLAKRGAAAGSEAIHAKRVTAAVVTLPSPVLTPRVAPERTRIVINAEDVFDAHINKLMLRSRKKFDHFDYDGNGLLEGAELLDLGEWLWSSFHPSEAASEKKKEAEGLKLLFRQDENGDGALSFEEFEGWFRKTCVAIEKYRRGLSNKPNLKMKPPVRKKMPKRQVVEVVEAHLPSEQVTVTAAPVVPRLKLGGVPSVVPRL